MSDIAIKVENLSKLYQLGEVGTGTISKDLNRLWARMRGKEDPYAKIGQTNDRTRKAESDFVWALDDINFEVKQGEVLGIIGRNGAGKSTLLKILSKITSPTTGKIYTKGRIASLLEVGTGFHPEMTGRENIYLNGAILGMRKWEIEKKFDEIVDFAGVEAYIDTPVKRYSSGMYVRLAFAVAAFLEPEILIVDEVLAVGDAEFQKKCLGRMKDVSKNDGRTILFVSHNMSAMKSLCSSGIGVHNGQIKYTGSIDSVIEGYLNSNLQDKNFNPKNETLQLVDVKIGNQFGESRALKYNDTLKIELFFNTKQELVRPFFWVGLRSQFGSIFGANSLLDNIRITDSVIGDFKVEYQFPNVKLLPQEYFIACGARDESGMNLIMSSLEVGSFRVIGNAESLNLYSPVADKVITDSAPILYPYSVSFNGKEFIHFKP